MNLSETFKKNGEPKIIKKANRIVLTAKLYLILLSCRFLIHFLLRGLTWAVLRTWTQNHHQVEGTCPGHHPQPIAQNCVFKIERSEPPHLK